MNQKKSSEKFVTYGIIELEFYYRACGFFSVLWLFCVSVPFVLSSKLCNNNNNTTIALELNMQSHWSRKKRVTFTTPRNRRLITIWCIFFFNKFFNSVLWYFISRSIEQEIMPNWNNAIGTKCISVLIYKWKWRLRLMTTAATSQILALIHIQFDRCLLHMMFVIGSCNEFFLEKKNILASTLGTLRRSHANSSEFNSKLLQKTRTMEESDRARKKNKGCFQA